MLKIPTLKIEVPSSVGVKFRRTVVVGPDNSTYSDYGKTSAQCPTIRTVCCLDARSLSSRKLAQLIQLILRWQEPVRLAALGEVGCVVSSRARRGATGFNVCRVLRSSSDCSAVGTRYDCGTIAAPDFCRRSSEFQHSSASADATHNIGCRCTNVKDNATTRTNVARHTSPTDRAGIWRDCAARCRVTPCTNTVRCAHLKCVTRAVGQSGHRCRSCCRSAITKCRPC